MTSLASRPNDLTAVHAQQFITYIFIAIFTAQLTLPSDDDYRLRQDLFQKYSNEQLFLPQTPSDLPLRRRLSVVSGFFSRAIGRSLKKHLPMAQNVVTSSPHMRQKLSFLSLRRSEQKHRQKQHQLPSFAPTRLGW